MQLKFSLFHHLNLDVQLVLHYKEKEGMRVTRKIKATHAENGNIGWYEHSVDLSDIPAGVIEKAEFVFTRGENRLSYIFLDNIVLVPKK